MAKMDARRAVGEKLHIKPSEKRQGHAGCRRPVQHVVPGALVHHKQEEVATEVDGGPPPLGREEQREHRGALEDLRVHRTACRCACILTHAIQCVAYGAWRLHAYNTTADAVLDLRRVHDEEHAEAARLGRGHVAHVPAQRMVLTPRAGVFAYDWIASGAHP